MEFFIHLISDLNRYLNLGLYVTFDGRSIHLNSLSQSKIILAMNAKQSFEFYQSLVELKRLITSWSNRYSLGQLQTAAKIAQTIYLQYNFNIEEHYQTQKYGTY